MGGQGKHHRGNWSSAARCVVEVAARCVVEVAAVGEQGKHHRGSLLAGHAPSSFQPSPAALEGVDSLLFQPSPTAPVVLCLSLAAAGCDN